MPDHPLLAEKLRSGAHFVLALIVMLIGIRGAGTPLGLVGFPIVVAGVVAASHAFGRLVRLHNLEKALLARARADFAEEYKRSNLPRQIYWLLLAIAEADGEAGDKERSLLREFLLERFPYENVHDMASWDAAGIDPIQAPLLAASVRALLSRSECETLFFWGCLVAFADGRFDQREHDLLHKVAAGLGLEAVHAKRIFQHAKHAFLGSDNKEQRRSRTDTPVASRQRALEILGLDANASVEDIRRRHRELAKRFHPDRHHHLGEAAAKEASARFREVQQAYELLTA